MDNNTFLNKAMTQEEKLEKAKELYPTANVDQRYVLECLFPELVESEDERIRKRLIFDFQVLGKTEWGDLKVKDILAWLEKQGEQKPNPYSGTSFEYNGHTWGMCARDGGAEVSMDGNLKAFISSDASFIYPDIPQPNLALKSALEEFKEEKVDNANKVEQNLANSAKTCKKSQRMVSAEAKEALYDKAAWSEEDEEMLDGIILRCEKYGHQEQINWFKSIKQRIKGE